MLPIQGSAVPSSASDLENALKAGFGRYGIAPKSITAKGENAATLTDLEVDLSNASVTRETRRPTAGKPGAKAVSAAHFSLKAAPLLIESIPAELSVRADSVDLGLSADGSDAVLIPIDAKNGEVTIEIARENLEKLLEKAASEAAGKQGVEIKDTKLEFTSRSERELSFKADVVGKVFVMKAPVSLTGDLRIDDDLNLHLSNLKVGGSGMLANLANGFAGPHLKKLETQPIALGVFSLGSLKLRDVRLQGGDTLKLDARFGS